MDHMDRDVGDVVAAPYPQGEALEFVRFCHRRKRVGWPELYDEMCAVAYPPATRTHSQSARPPNSGNRSRSGTLR